MTQGQGVETSTLDLRGALPVAGVAEDQAHQCLVRDYENGCGIGREIGKCGAQALPSLVCAFAARCLGVRAP
ncbi:MAG: hypothetical protein AAGH68_12330, partial [Pseudomonadota bacterium]